MDNATYDALKAFQLNTINSDTSDLSNSKLRDIEASANTFFNSIASNFNMAGYNQDILKDYVPALVYTMYDGYYIYSPYTNTLDNTNHNLIEDDSGQKKDNGSDAKILNKDNENATYKEGEKISGVKPYIYYSCRYKYDDKDIVITYSLDNYITIQGSSNNGKTAIYDAGYVLDNIEEQNNKITYRGIEIGTEMSSEQISPNDEKYNYIKINGVKYYQDGNSWFSILNGKKYPQEQFDPKNGTAFQYYKEAKAFKERIKGYGLGDLNASDAVDEVGDQLVDENGKPKFGKYKIFDFGSSSGTSIEDPNSNFNEQRLAVIRYSIEKNLSIAIANYNSYSGGKILTDFKMPKLKEDEWDKIINNVSIISFLQGLNIGGKIYNGYSIVTNNKNKEVVSEDSIYIVTNDNQYHRANDSDLINNTNVKITEGVWNINFERKSYIDSEGITKYFFPKDSLGCYSSIVTQPNVNVTDNFYKYIAECKNTDLAKTYYTALARERYGLYRANNDPDELKRTFGDN